MLRPAIHKDWALNRLSFFFGRVASQPSVMVSITSDQVAGEVVSTC